MKTTKFQKSAQCRFLTLLVIASVIYLCLPQTPAYAAKAPEKKWVVTVSQPVPASAFQTNMTSFGSLAPEPTPTPTIGLLGWMVVGVVVVVGTVVVVGICKMAKNAQIHPRTFGNDGDEPPTGCTNANFCHPDWPHTNCAPITNCALVTGSFTPRTTTLNSGPVCSIQLSALYDATGNGIASWDVKANTYTNLDPAGTPYFWEKNYTIQSSTNGFATWQDEYSCTTWASDYWITVVWYRGRVGYDTKGVYHPGPILWIDRIPGDRNGGPDMSYQSEFPGLPSDNAPSKFYRLMSVQ